MFLYLNKESKIKTTTKTYNTIKTKSLFWVFVIVLFCSFYIVHSTKALAAIGDPAAPSGPCTIPTPVDLAKNPFTSNFGKRNCSGCSPVHTGTDYDGKCGDRIPAPPPGCKKIGDPGKTPYANGYGNVAQYDCGNGIKLQYGHLNGDSAINADGTLSMGNTGSTSAGKNPTCNASGSGDGSHLDYKIFIDGKEVDAQCATGVVSGDYKYGGSSVKHGILCPVSGQPNLCNPKVREDLLKHAEQVIGGAGKGLATPSGETGGGQQEGQDTGTPTSVNQGTQDGGAGDGGGSGSGGNNDPLDIPQTDPEEEDNPPPEPSEEYEGQATKPICDNSTCIVQDMIDNAKHKHVQYDKVKDYVEYLTHEGKCKNPTETKVTVFRQAEGETKKYPDAFCTNQGCAYKNEGGEGSGKCE